MIGKPRKTGATHQAIPHGHGGFEGDHTDSAQVGKPLADFLDTDQEDKS